jgi:hypothetical protein
MTVHKLAGIVVAETNGPELDARQVGALGWSVELRSNAAFSTAQIAACVLGSTVAIGVSVPSGELVWTGTVSGFGTRPGYSKIVIVDAVVTFVPT